MNTKITKKIEGFFNLEFGDLIKELSKQKKILSLQDQDEWGDYFQIAKNYVLVQNDEIKKIEKHLEDVIYGLYGLSDKEQKFIEESLQFFCQIFDR